MRLPTFIGGIHPPDNKALTADKEIEVYVPKGDLVFPMSQHIGVPCTPIVKKGDRVLVGQKIADSDAFVSAPILSSVSGTVKEVGVRMTIPGTLEPCIVVESDGEFEHDVTLLPHKEYESLDPKEYLVEIGRAS